MVRSGAIQSTILFVSFFALISCGREEKKAASPANQGGDTQSTDTSGSKPGGPPPATDPKHPRTGVEFGYWVTHCQPCPPERAIVYCSMALTDWELTSGAAYDLTSQHQVSGSLSSSKFPVDRKEQTLEKTIHVASKCWKERHLEWKDVEVRTCCPELLPYYKTYGEEGLGHFCDEQLRRFAPQIRQYTGKSAGNCTP